jgi:hypothetical protein
VIEVVFGKSVYFLKCFFIFAICIKWENKTILEELKISFEKGDLEELFKHKFDEKRMIDFILLSDIYRIF